MLGLGLSLTSPTRIGGAITPEEAANLQDLYQVGNPGPSSSDDTPTIVFHSEIVPNPAIAGGELLNIYELVLVENVDSTWINVRTLPELLQEAVDLSDSIADPAQSELTADPVKPLTALAQDGNNNRLLTRLLADGYYSSGSALNTALPDSYFNINHGILLIDNGTVISLLLSGNLPSWQNYRIENDILHPEIAESIVDPVFNFSSGDPYSAMIEYIENDEYTPLESNGYDTLFSTVLNLNSNLARLFFRKTRAAVDTGVVLPPLGIMPLPTEITASPDIFNEGVSARVFGSAVRFFPASFTERTFQFIIQNTFIEYASGTTAGNDISPLGPDDNGDVEITEFKTKFQITFAQAPPLVLAKEITFTLRSSSIDTYPVSGETIRRCAYDGEITFTEEEFPPLFSANGDAIFPITIANIKNTVPGSNTYINSSVTSGLFPNNLYMIRAGANIFDLLEWLAALADNN